MQVVFLGTKTPPATCQNLLNDIELANQYCSENRVDTFSGQFGAMSITPMVAQKTYRRPARPGGTDALLARPAQTETGAFRSSPRAPFTQTLTTFFVQQTRVRSNEGRHFGMNSRSQQLLRARLDHLDRRVWQKFRLTLERDNSRLVESRSKQRISKQRIQEEAKNNGEKGIL